MHLAVIPGLRKPRRGFSEPLGFLKSRDPFQGTGIRFQGPGEQPEKQSSSGDILVFCILLVPGAWYLWNGSRLLRFCNVLLTRKRTKPKGQDDTDRPILTKGDGT
jgi:hypothetical protein